THPLLRYTVAWQTFSISLHDALPISCLVKAQRRFEARGLDKCGDTFGRQDGDVARVVGAHLLDGRVVQAGAGHRLQPQAQHRGRSEEHTSELQSRENLVSRILLEKK